LQKKFGPSFKLNSHSLNVSRIRTDHCQIWISEHNSQRKKNTLDTRKRKTTQTRHLV